MSTVRQRRLHADSEKLHDYVRSHPRVRLIQKHGDPPERYQLEYRIKSLRMVGGELQSVSQHLVEVTLPLNYPRTPPQCRMLSPVFHPNIAPHAICVGDHWAAGESLESIVIRIGEMLAFQSYNVKSPLNGEAARWVEENRDQLPLDPVSLLPEAVENAPASSTAMPPTTSPATPPVAPAPRTSPILPAHSTVPLSANDVSSELASTRVNGKAQCPECKAEYKLTPAVLGKRVRCSKCGNVFVCT
jgi:predicted Zn finger-like uncharacterized protein